MLGSVQLQREVRTFDEWMRDPSVVRKNTGALKSYVPSASGQAHSPYGSDGQALMAVDDEPNPMLAAVSYADSDGAGEITSTALIGAFPTGKNVIYEIAWGSGLLAAGATLGAAFNVAFSDVAQWAAVQMLGGRGMLLGPVKQGTSNTAINVSAAAGSATANTRFSFSVRYRQVAD